MDRARARARCRGSGSYRFDTPPYTWTPGQRRLISRVASMNALAKSSCSSMPGGDRQDVGVEDDVAGVVSGLAGEQPDARSQISILRSTVPAWPSRRSHHHDGRSVVADRRAFSRKSSSPSFRLIEFTTPLPWMHFRPASRTVHRELSTMIGTRAISGSVAIRLRNRRHGLLGVEEVGVHVDVEHVRAALYLVERDLDGRLEVAGSRSTAGTSPSR